MLQSQRKTWLSSRFSTFRYQVSLYFTFMNNPAEHRFDSFLGNIFPHPCYKKMFWPPWDQKQENLWWAGSGKEWMGMERRKKRNKQTRQHLHAGSKGTRLCTKTQGSGICFLGQPTWDTKPCSSTDIYPNCVHFSEQSSNPQYHIPLEDSSSFFFFLFGQSGEMSKIFFVQKWNPPISHPDKLKNWDFQWFCVGVYDYTFVLLSHQQRPNLIWVLKQDLR